MKKILVIGGTRPEIIKLAPLILFAKEKFKNKIEIKFCCTQQHFSLANSMLLLFNLRSEFSLKLMKSNQTLDYISQKIFEKLPKIFEKFLPNIVIVQGDTTTAMITSLCAFHNKIPVAHVESGLRSFDLFSPFPEEANRKIISSIATYNFTPTEISRQNLLDENISENKIFITGNTIIDSINLIRRKNNLDNLISISNKIRKPFILITSHRRESIGIDLKNICEAIKISAKKNPRYQFIFPIHLNPKVRKIVFAILKNLENVLLIEPLDYIKFLTLIKHCEFIVTDSGGIQEEAPSFKKYCIVVRNHT